MGAPGAAVRRRSDGEETRRRVLDAVADVDHPIGDRPTHWGFAFRESDTYR